MAEEGGFNIMNMMMPILMISMLGPLFKNLLGGKLDDFKQENQDQKHEADTAGQTWETQEGVVTGEGLTPAAMLEIYNKNASEEGRNPRKWSYDEQYEFASGLYELDAAERRNVVRQTPSWDRTYWSRFGRDHGWGSLFI
jgi:hypothetical protein